MRVIVNTSPLIALDRIGRLDLLRRLFGSVVRPQSVLDEILEGERQYGVPSELRRSEWILTEPDPEETVFMRELGAGETAVLALARKTGADLVVLDDLRARLAAASLGLKVTGTLGVLVAAHRADLLPNLADAFTQLRDSGFRISRTITERLLP